MMIKKFENKIIAYCCPVCGNESLIDYYNDIYCDECKKISHYSDLQLFEKTIGEVELEVKEREYWIKY